LLLIGAVTLRYQESALGFPLWTFVSFVVDDVHCWPFK
jgi:hypothetical protein